MERRIIILTWLCFFSLSICLAKTTITINNEELEKTPYKIEAIGINLRVIFDDNTSIISRMDDTIIRFDDPSGIKTIEIPEYYNFKKKLGSVVQIDGFNDGDFIHLYSGNGVLLFSTRSEGTSLTLDISGYTNGIYVLKINNKSIKFTK
jgi:hypothetical protein